MGRCASFLLIASPSRVAKLDDRLAHEPSAAARSHRYAARLSELSVGIAPGPGSGVMTVSGRF